MKRITIKEAAEMLNVGEQRVRVLIQQGKIKGPIWTGTKRRRNYIITDEQIINFMKGGNG